MTKLYLGYARVSSNQQAISGLSLEHQQAAINDYVTKCGGELLQVHVERESGKKNDRPILLKVIAECKKRGAVLIISRLDRLGRRVSLIASLLESRIEIICADNPSATKTMLQMLSVFAEFERDLISQRTHEALQAARARGVILGSYGKDVLSQRNISNANTFADGMKNIIAEIRSQGHTTVRAVAAALNSQGVKPAGNADIWQPASTYRLLKRIDTMAA